MGSLAPIAERYVKAMSDESEASARVAKAEGELVVSMKKAGVKAIRHGSTLLCIDRGGIKASPLPDVPTSDLVSLPPADPITPADVDGIGSVPKCAGASVYSTGAVDAVLDDFDRNLAVEWNPSDEEIDEAAGTAVVEEVLEAINVDEEVRGLKDAIRERAERARGPHVDAPTVTAEESLPRLTKPVLLAALCAGVASRIKSSRTTPED